MDDMMNRKTANEMARDIARGVTHYDSISNRAGFIVKVLERYGVIEKTKENAKVFGGTKDTKADAGLTEDCLTMEDDFTKE